MKLFTPRPRGPRRLIGVYHTEDTFPETTARLMSYKPCTLGLELPSDYRQRLKTNTIFYFGDLISLAPRIIPLEEPHYWDQAQTYRIVKEARVREQKGEPGLAETIAHMEQRLKSPYASPERKHYYAALLRRLRAAHAVSAGRSDDELEEEWQELNRRRETVMLERVLAATPDVVVIGDAHAQQLAPVLAEYRYERIASLKKRG